MATPDRRELASVFSRISVDENGCWLWTGCLTGKGYAAYRGNGAHRFTHEWFVGPIAAGLEVDHLCRVRRCVNPAHLEAVTGLVNRMRGAAYVYHSGFCRRGHVLADVGVARNGPDEVICRECRRISQARYWLRKNRPMGPVLRGVLMREAQRLHRESRRDAVAS